MLKAMYVHVPFCDSICAYCDFGRCKMQPQLADRWLTAIERELSVSYTHLIHQLQLEGKAKTSAREFYNGAGRSYIGQEFNK